MIVGDFVDQHVVYESAMFVEQPGVLRLADFEPLNGIGGNEIGELRRLGSCDFDLAHVADVEQTHRAAHGLVFVNNARILHWHVPTAEIHHLGAHGSMYGIERSCLQRAGSDHECLI